MEIAEDCQLTIFHFMKQDILAKLTKNKDKTTSKYFKEQKKI